MSHRRSRAPFATKVIPERAARRAAERYVVDANGCHISTYSVGSHGYAQVGWKVNGDGRRCDMTTAHRAAWVHHRGPIPDGMTVDHLCRVRRCVNVAHLRLLTNLENASDNGQTPVGPPASTPCTKGHPRRIGSQGPRCPTCDNARKRAYRRRVANGESA